MAETRYVQSRDGTYIAYQVTGDGPIDLVYVPTWVSQVEQLWEDPGVAGFFNRLASFSRLILFDRRGSGLSDPTPGTLEEQMDDVLAVMDAAGSERAGLFAQLEGGAMAALFAATHPDRVGALALYATFPRASWAEDYDWALKPEDRVDPAHAQRFDLWGTGAMVDMFAPSMAHDDRFRAWFAKLERLSASPGMILRINEMIAATDVRDVLPSIRVPTLVLHRPNDACFDFRHSQYLAEHIPGARLVEVPGTDTLPHIGEGSELITDELEVFFTGARGRGEADRVLATVMFTDIVGSTQHAARLGDLRFRELLDRHHELVRRQLDRYRGREVKTIGDGFLATFDGPARAIRAASEITDSVRALGIELRAGLHTGELEVIGNDVGGLAVHIGARVSELAEPGEVLVSSTVKDLVVGSGIEFAERGTTELRGVPGEWRLYAVAAPH